MNKTEIKTAEEKILKLINDYWKFDDNQQPQASWHEKQALLKEVEKELALHPVSMPTDEIENKIIEIIKSLAHINYRVEGKMDAAWISDECYAEMGKQISKLLLSPLVISDEKINEAAENYFQSLCITQKARSYPVRGFIAGVKWLRDLQTSNQKMGAESFDKIDMIKFALFYKSLPFRFQKETMEQTLERFIDLHHKPKAT